MPQILELNVPRHQVVAFALYTHDAGVLKLTAQLYPLLPDEPREARLEIQRNGAWKELASAPVEYPGWSAHFRVKGWDSTKAARYRVRHGAKAAFDGIIRQDPIDKDVIVVANLGCNSSRTKGPRPEIVERLLRDDPDLLFFSGDQTYHHTEHTAGWIEFGLQYRALMKDRPTVCIPDDHDVGHPNLWGEEGGHSTHSGATIVATNVERGEDWTAVSNAQGYYTIPFLPSGRYFGGGFTQDPQRRAGTGSGLADFMLGIPSSASLSTIAAGGHPVALPRGIRSGRLGASPIA